MFRFQHVDFSLEVAPRGVQRTDEVEPVLAGLKGKAERGLCYR